MLGFVFTGLDGSGLLKFPLAVLNVPLAQLIFHWPKGPGPATNVAAYDKMLSSR